MLEPITAILGGIVIGMFFHASLLVLQSKRKCSSCGDNLPKKRKPGHVKAISHDLTTR